LDEDISFFGSANRIVDVKVGGEYYRPGAIVRINFIWLLSDITNGLMAFPNLIGISGLRGVGVKMIKDHFSREQKPLL
jgi:Na+/alanine symporter